MTGDAECNAAEQRNFRMRDHPTGTQLARLWWLDTHDSDSRGTRMAGM